MALNTPYTLDEVKELNEKLNGFLSDNIAPWEEVNINKMKALDSYFKTINEARNSDLSFEELQLAIEDAEDIRDMSIAACEIKESELATIARDDLEKRLKELKMQYKQMTSLHTDVQKGNDDFKKCKAEIKTIKESLNSHSKIAHTLHNISEKMWNKTIAPLIEGIKSKDIDKKKETVDKGDTYVANANRYAEISKGIGESLRKGWDLSKEGVKNVTDFAKLMHAKSYTLEARICLSEINSAERKVEKLEAKIDNLVTKKIGVTNKIFEHESKRMAKKGIILPENIKINTPKLDVKIAKAQKELLEAQKDLAICKLEYHQLEQNRNDIVKGTKYEGQFVSDNMIKAKEAAEKQFKDAKAQLDNASAFDISMASVININDKLMESAFAERTEIKGEEIPVYRVVIDSKAIKDKNILNARTIANLSGDERIYPTNQGYSYIYTTDPSRAVEWSQEFSKRGALHGKGVECSSDKAEQLYKEVAEKNKGLGITEKQNKKHFNEEMDR